VEWSASHVAFTARASQIKCKNRSIKQSIRPIALSQLPVCCWPGLIFETCTANRWKSIEIHKNQCQHFSAESIFLLFAISLELHTTHKIRKIQNTGEKSLFLGLISALGALTISHDRDRRRFPWIQTRASSHCNWFDFSSFHRDVGVFSCRSVEKPEQSSCALHSLRQKYSLLILLAGYTLWSSGSFTCLEYFTLSLCFNLGSKTVSLCILIFNYIFVFFIMSMYWSFRSYWSVRKKGMMVINHVAGGPECCLSSATFVAIVNDFLSQKSQLFG